MQLARTVHVCGRPIGERPFASVCSMTKMEFNRVIKVGSLLGFGTDIRACFQPEFSVCQHFVKFLNYGQEGGGVLFNRCPLAQLLPTLLRFFLHCSLPNFLCRTFQHCPRWLTCSIRQGHFRGIALLMHSTPLLIGFARFEINGLTANPTYLGGR